MYKAIIIYFVIDVIIGITSLVSINDCQVNSFAWTLFDGVFLPILIIIYLILGSNKTK
jgi:Na+-translocating ferredoxin:NAD+ oxidoreductase RnfE subunit